MKIFLDFVTVLYNHSQELICSWLDNLVEKFEYNKKIFDFTIRLVDNSDKHIIDKDILFTNPDYKPYIEYIKTEENIGYCGGNNLGCEKANEHAFIIICNPDLFIKDSLVIDWLYGIAIQYNCISGILRNGRDWLTYPSMFPTVKQYTPETLPFAYDFNPQTALPDQQWKSLPYIDGSLMCFSKQLWNKVRFDDLIFPGYYGETAFQYKAQQLGFPLKHVPIEKMLEHKSESDLQYSIADKKKWAEEARRYFYKEYALKDYEYFLAKLV